MGSKKVLGILSHRQFGVPWVRTAWTESYWSFLRESFAEEAAREVAGRTVVSAHRLLCNSCHHPTAVLSGSRSKWLSAVRCSENGSQGWPVSQPWRASNGMRRPNSARFQKKPNTSACNSGRIDGTSVCERVRAFMCARARVYVEMISFWFVIEMGWMINLSLQKGIPF
jgi:hypothetical protein